MGNEQGPTVEHRELCSMLCGGLGGGSLGESGCVHYVWLSPSVVHLKLSQHTPIQNKKLKNKTKQKKQRVRNTWEKSICTGLQSFAICFHILPNLPLQHLPQKKKEKWLGGLRRNRGARTGSVTVLFRAQPHWCQTKAARGKGVSSISKVTGIRRKAHQGASSLCKPEVPWGPSSNKLHFQVTFSSSSGPVLPRSWH